MDWKEYDRQLGIKTAGVKEWDGHRHYHGYEPTPYWALERLCQVYRFHPGDRVVDFGCGRGRVAFFLHHHFHVPVVGIEADAKTYEEALLNLRAYLRQAKHAPATITFEHGLAEKYQVDAADNRFYFFNPFSSLVFQKVMGNILKSVAAHPRTVDVILFYPMPGYTVVLEGLAFELVLEIELPEAQDPLDKFLIYRYPARRRGRVKDSDALVPTTAVGLR